MKKILLSTLALVIMSAGMAYADNGKRNSRSKKAVQKQNAQAGQVAFAIDP